MPRRQDQKRAVGSPPVSSLFGLTVRLERSSLTEPAAIFELPNLDFRQIQNVVSLHCRALSDAFGLSDECDPWGRKQGATHGQRLLPFPQVRWAAQPLRWVDLGPLAERPVVLGAIPCCRTCGNRVRIPGGQPALASNCSARHRSELHLYARTRRRAGGRGRQCAVPGSSLVVAYR
jgi:hypothetical protein